MMLYPPLPPCPLPPRVQPEFLQPRQPLSVLDAMAALRRHFDHSEHDGYTNRWAFSTDGWAASTNRWAVSANRWAVDRRCFKAGEHCRSWQAGFAALGRNVLCRAPSGCGRSGAGCPWRAQRRPLPGAHTGGALLGTNCRTYVHSAGIPCTLQGPAGALAPCFGHMDPMVFKQHTCTCVCRLVGCCRDPLEPWRPVAVLRASQGHVVRLRPRGALPDALSATVYIAMAMPALSPFVPIYKVAVWAWVLAWLGNVGLAAGRHAGWRDVLPCTAVAPRVLPSLPCSDPRSQALPPGPATRGAAACPGDPGGA